MSTLIAVAHGSRDARSAQVVHDVVRAVRRRRPDLDVRVAFLDLTEPSVDDVVDRLTAEGATTAIVTPLLLGRAFHARVDLPAILDQARRRHPGLTLIQSDVLGDDRRLVNALRSRISETGINVADPDVGVMVAAVGSSNSSANQRSRTLADRVRAGTRWRAAVTCFATSQNPGPAEALSRLRAAGATRIVLAPWFLAPGLLTDRVSAAIEGDVVVADVLGNHPLVAEVVASRYDAAAETLSARMSA